MTDITPKDLALRCFKPVALGSSTWKYFCGKSLKKNRNGYTNLASHVYSQHADYIKQLSEGSVTDYGTDRTNPFIINDKTRRIFAWLAVILLGLEPWSFCESEVIRRNFNYRLICVNTLTKYIHALTWAVERKVSQALPERFAEIFDGWSNGDTHYLSLFSFMQCKSENGYNTFLLSFSPLEDETKLTAEEHVKTITWVLQNFGKSADNVVALIGDNSAVNRSIARLLKCGFVGCASHRFNLAVNDYLAPHNDLLGKIKAIMKVLCNFIPAATLRKITPLKPMKRNTTRWSSTFSMIHRYIPIRSFLPKLELKEVTDLLITPCEDSKVDDLYVQLADLESVTKALQCEDVRLCDVRDLFDEVISTFGNCEDRLGPNASIIEHKDFDNALVKLQKMQFSELSTSEKSAVYSLVISSSEAPDATMEMPLSLAQRALKKRRMDISTESQYISDTRFIVPTSNLCERFFSKAGYALGDRRRRLDPTSFEEQMFLHVNSTLWAMEDVNSIVVEGIISE